MTAATVAAVVVGVAVVAEVVTFIIPIYCRGSTAATHRRDSREDKGAQPRCPRPTRPVTHIC